MSKVHYEVRRLEDSPVQALQKQPDLGVRLKECFFSKYFLGLLALVLTVALWLASSFVTADILQTYDKPFLMTYLTVLPLSIYFIFLWTGDPLRPKKQKVMDEMDAMKTLPPLNTKQIALIAVPFVPLYTLSCYLNNFAYSATTVSSAAIMGCTSTLFILIIGSLVRVERVTVLKVVAASLCLLGAGLLVWREFDERKTMVWWGNLAGMGSALCYAGYSVYLKRIAGDESRVSQPILFAFTAAYSFISLWPFLLILHFTGVETLELPHSKHQYAAIIANVILGGLIPNFLWNVAFAWTSELVVSVGLACSLPLTLLMDYLWNGTPIGWVKGIAATLVVLGFIPINLATVFPESDRDLGCGSPAPKRKPVEMSQVE